eukprot:8387834-Pyramimonas_sp.AAC.2
MRQGRQVTQIRCRSSVSSGWRAQEAAVLQKLKDKARALFSTGGERIASPSFAEAQCTKTRPDWAHTVFERSWPASLLQGLRAITALVVICGNHSLGRAAFPRGADARPRLEPICARLCAVSRSIRFVLVGGLATGALRPQ